MTAIVRLRLPRTTPCSAAIAFSTPLNTRRPWWPGAWHISGQIGLRPDGTVPDTVREQIEWAFKRAEAILRRLGLDFSDVVEMVSYHVDVGAQLSDFREVKSRYMRADFPAWTILGVAELARPALAVEIRLVAATRA